MPNILHANAKTTPRIRKEIQESKKSISELAQTLNLNVKTIKKWKNRDDITDKKYYLFVGIERSTKYIYVEL
jgi:uncharacterized protein YjcR